MAMVCATSGAVFAPSTGTPVRGGLTWREAHFVAEEVASTGQLVSMDLVEVNPALMGEQEVSSTLAMGVDIIGSALGHTIV